VVERGGYVDGHVPHNEDLTHIPRPDGVVKQGEAFDNEYALSITGGAIGEQSA
jgi:hypothetical protein